MDATIPPTVVAWAQSTSRNKSQHPFQVGMDLPVQRYLESRTVDRELALPMASSSQAGHCKLPLPSWFRVSHSVRDPESALAVDEAIAAIASVGRFQIAS
jgi:hypothetical protein